MGERQGFGDVSLARAKETPMSKDGVNVKKPVKRNVSMNLRHLWS